MAIRECDCKEFQDSGHTDECNEYYKPKKIASVGEVLSFDEKNTRNRRVQNRYDELMAIGENGHYETLFRIVNEEVELAARKLTVSIFDEKALEAALDNCEMRYRDDVEASIRNYESIKNTTLP